MLTRLQFMRDTVNGVNESWYVPILDATPDEPLVITNISGLEAPDRQLWIGDYVRDGGVYLGKSTVSRNPVIDFMIRPGYERDETVTGLRALLYKTFYEPVKQPVIFDEVVVSNRDGLMVVVEDDEVQDRYFIGYAEKYVGPIFDKTPTASFSLLAPDPYLRATHKTVLTAPGLGWLSTPVDYDGTSSVGFEMTIHIEKNTPTLNISNGLYRMSISGSFLYGDTLYINTNEGERSILVNGSRSFLSGLSNDSTWLTLNPTENLINIYGVTPGDTNATFTSLTYRSAWVGV